MNATTTTPDHDVLIVGTGFSGLGMAIKLNVLLASGLLFLSTTRIEEFSYALCRLGLPYKVGFTMTMAFRLVPVFLDSALAVVQAQRCRGLDFERGSLWHTAVVAVGGDHFTSDIAVGLRTPIPDAERVKRKNGCALSSMVDEDETIEVASVGGRKPRLMARRILSEILQPRAEEIFHIVWDEVRRAGYEKSLNSGIVLTGGGSILEGMPEIAEQIFDLPIRRGCPMGATASRF